jgi:hypothetical protein
VPHLLPLYRSSELKLEELVTKRYATAPDIGRSGCSSERRVLARAAFLVGRAG